MKDKMLNIPQMLLIGSTGRNSGKTTLSMALVQALKKYFHVVGLKVTTIEERDGKCPRGGEGCGVCGSLKGNFEIIEETSKLLNKDTSLLLASGAEKVYWIKTLKAYSGEAIKAFMSKIPTNTLIICESNSLRNVVKPGVFVMLNNRGDAPIKKSAKEVIDKANIVIGFDFRDNINSVIEKIEVYQSELSLSFKVKSSVSDVS